MVTYITRKWQSPDICSVEWEGLTAQGWPWGTVTETVSPGVPTQHCRGWGIRHASEDDSRQSRVNPQTHVALKSTQLQGHPCTAIPKTGLYQHRVQGPSLGAEAAVKGSGTGKNGGTAFPSQLPCKPDPADGATFSLTFNITVSSLHIHTPGIILSL